MSENDPIRCIHCCKEIPDIKTHGELCPKQKPVNGIPLSHGLTVEDHVRLSLAAIRSKHA